MSSVMPGAEPFFFAGGEVGCLISHGGGSTPQSVRSLGRSIAREGGCSVSGPLLSGHGTVPEDLRQYTWQDWVWDTERHLALLRECCSKVFLVGLAEGAALVLRAAAEHPDALAGVVAINAPLFQVSPSVASALGAAGAPEFLPGMGSDIKAPGVSELAYDRLPVPALQQLGELLRETQKLLPQVKSPALVLQSREDHVVPPENGPALLEALGSSTKRLVWLEDSYHVAPLDNDKERLAREIVEFIRQHA